MAKLYVGLDVDIQRTNGRVHSAIISNVDEINRSVTVEWQEEEEVKGKEIDFESIFDLNPNLADNAIIKNDNQGLTSNKKQLNQVRHSYAPSKGSLRMKNAPSNRSVLNNTGFSNFKEPQLPSVNHNSNGNNIGSAPTPLNSTNVLKYQINNSTQSHNDFGVLKSGAQTQQSAAASRRRSNVVKEVDRIKKQREERRYRQAEQKAEKSELMSSVEPGNPNWEFLGMIREFRSQLEYKPISMNDPVEAHQICVAVRKRPMNKKEAQKKDIDVITIPTKDLIAVHEPKNKVDLTKYLENHMFRFDYAFDENSDNELVYKYTAKPLVQTIFEGGMATCFAYGQTGSGKSHTMGGNFTGKSQDSSKGIYALTARDVFKFLKSPKYRHEDLYVTASFFEIYSGKVFDLLNQKSKLRVLEDARQQVQIVGLQERPVESVDEVLKLIQMGNNIRTSGVTSANSHSSRSHAVFQIILKKRMNKKLHGKFSLIDLAGNERGVDTSSANRQTRMEGAEINKSLLALKECIRALGRKGTHTPFRASKLTQVLRDSFIGNNSRTCMIAMISPGMQSCENSLNTLRYADRVKELGTEDRDSKNDELDELEDENGDEDDLALLHSSNGVELNDDLYTFHEAISHLQEAEEEILDTHKQLFDQMPQEIIAHENLLSMTVDVDYDVDNYSMQLEEMLNNKIEFLHKFREMVKEFRQNLAEEERISQKIIK